MKDLRDYARQTNVRLIIGAFILLFVVGLGLIWIFYGKAAAGMGLLCLLGALVPILLIGLIFGGMDWILKNVRPK